MDKVEKKPKFRDYLRENVEKRLETPFSNLTPLDQSREFTRYYVQSVLAKIMPGLVPDDDADVADSLIDGPGCELGVDFISRSEGRVLIIQSKSLLSG